MGKKKVLVLAPHTDDGEFGCGGTIARLIEEGNDIYYVAFSTCRASVPEGESPDVLKKELIESMKVFKIPRNQVFVFDYPVRRFSENRQDILEDIIKIQNNLEPDIVFAPSQRDIHQDHKVISDEAMRAFKKCTLLFYEIPWNNFSFNNQAYYIINDKHLDVKKRAIACYKSQSTRKYSDEKFTIGQAIMHGVQIGAKYAEVFEVARCVL